MEICKNGNSEKRYLGKMDIGEMDIGRHENLEKFKPGKKEIVKMDIRKNDIWGNWENCKFGKM